MEDCNSIEGFNKLDDKSKKSLVEWCKKTFLKSKKKNNSFSSYELKHLFEKDEDGFYVTNGQFKGAMKEAGFDTYNTTRINWYFNIDHNSLKVITKKIYNY